MMEAILHLYDRAVELVDKGVPVSAMAEAGLFDKLVKDVYKRQLQSHPYFKDSLKGLSQTNLHRAQIEEADVYKRQPTSRMPASVSTLSLIRKYFMA